MFRLHFSTSNDSFGSDPHDKAQELARILKMLANKSFMIVTDENDTGLIKDLNGNTIGAYSLTDEN